MQTGTDKLLDRAERALSRAREELHTGRTDMARERAYRAMIYAARALLNEVGLRVRTHTAVADALARLYGDTGRLGAEPCRRLASLVQRYASRANDDPPEGDWCDADHLLEQARQFVGAARATVRGSEP